MRILGIDPGIERLGWGIVDTIRSKSQYIDCGCIKTPKDLPQPERLALISKELRALIQEKRPERAVVEKLFFATNKKTAISVAEARGVILVSLHQENIPIFEFTPLEVKRSLTGNGNAEKKQVAWMVRNILKLDESIRSDDALDALALSLMVQG